MPMTAAELALLRTAVDDLNGRAPEIERAFRVLTDAVTANEQASRRRTRALWAAIGAGVVLMILGTVLGTAAVRQADRNYCYSLARDADPTPPPTTERGIQIQRDAFRELRNSDCPQKSQLS